jgi:FimV-like protein
MLQHIFKFGTFAAICLAAPLAFSFEILVENGDTLMKIANQTRSSDSISPAQQAVAIFELNPKAFNNKNMNGLQRGSKLEIPTADQASSVSAEEALTISRQHQVAWYEGIVVKKGETLMEIAVQTRSDESISMAQQAKALFDLNRRAFSKGNINGLRWGMKLRVPNQDLAESTSADEALQWIHEQNRDWRTGRKSTATANSAVDKPTTETASAMQSRERSAQQKPVTRSQQDPQPVTIIRGSEVEVTKVRH